MALRKRLRRRGSFWSKLKNALNLPQPEILELSGPGPYRLNCGVVFASISKIIFPRPSSPEGEFLETASGRVPLGFIRNRRARRYILRVLRDGSARITVPGRGSIVEARAFAVRQTRWVERQLTIQAQRGIVPVWAAGSEILLRGVSNRIEVRLTERGPEIHLGTEIIREAELLPDLRPVIENHLWRIAGQEMPGRVQELAAGHQLAVRRVCVRNQRSRWGSCSARGTICLNWRLIQAPEFVRDYIILHELAHLRQMNHSAAFWQDVELMCPDYRRAEQWLKSNRGLLAA